MMTDEMVLATQKWLNKTYGDVAGFEKAPENGQTGWPTIYSLRMGLQHELGITNLAEGFGPATKAALSPVVSKIVVGYKHNIAQLIQGAFWCKGISPEDFMAEFTPSTLLAIKQLQSDAGLVADGKVTVPLIAALFDMSAFSLVGSGYAKIREMKQDLNRQFAAQMEQIIPCDGIYQRDTNTALIFALQIAEGLGEKANGVYGQQTINSCPTLAPGSSNARAVKVLQYGLLVNGYGGVNLDGKFTADLSNTIVLFCERMNTQPINGDLVGNRVIKALLTSNGDTTRDSIACDTSKVLQKDDVSLLKKYGFSIVGRYLTGSVGVGANERAKNLTIAEINRITDGGLSIFPIYQDGGAMISYFNSAQGLIDGVLAISTAKRLGFVSGTTIYFACDVDLQENNIETTLMNYMRGVNQAFENTKLPDYQVGIYGTRNVCSHVITGGLAKYCFVSDMSTGYSGNLGYAMPASWSFDQFIEYSIGSSLPIDQVATDRKISDPGCKTFVPGTITDADKKIVINDLMPKQIDNLFTFEFGKTYTIPTPTPGLIITWEAKTSVGEGPIIFEDGKIKNEAKLTQKISDELGGITNTTAYVAALNESDIRQVGAKISVGSLDFTTTVDSDGTLSVAITANIVKAKIFGDVKVNLSISWTFKYLPNFWDNTQNDINTVTENQKKPFALHASLESAASMGIGIAVTAFLAKIMSVAMKLMPFFAL